MEIKNSKMKMEILLELIRMIYKVVSQK